LSKPDAKPNPDEPRERLLLAAEALFAGAGYDGTTVRAICDAAGMNVASINYHFGDKQRLYVETVRNAHCSSTDHSPMPEWPARMPAAAKLSRLIGHLVDHMTIPIRPSAMQLVMRELSNPSSAAHSVVEDFIRPMSSALRDIVRELVPQLPEKQRLMVGLSIVGQCLYYRQNQAVSRMLFGEDAISDLTTEAITEHVVRFSFAALGLAKSYPKVVEKEGAL